VTPETLRHCLEALAWSQRGLADQLGLDSRQVRRWAAGAAIPPPVAAWLALLAAFHERHPPPRRP